MRKTIQKLALMAIALLSSVAASAQTFDVGDLRFTVISGTSNVKVEAVNKSTINGDITIPATVENDGTTYNVTTIAYNGFNNADNMTSVVIPDGITTIENYAFYSCDGLTSVSLPNTVTTMGYYVFQYCVNLASAEFSTGMTSVPSHCFDNCHAMGSVTGLDNVKRLEIAAFGNCRGFTSFTIPANVEYIGQYALGDLHNCESYTFAGNKVTEIYNLAFQNNTKLTSITIPESVTTLGESVFYNCTSLTSVTLPSNITKLPNGTFNGCTALASYTIPSNITEIGDNAFNNCTSLQTVDIPSGVTKIGGGAFYRTNLSSVTLPSSLQSIGNTAFRGSKLTSFTIPSGVALGTYILEGCTSLTSVTIAEGVTVIPDYTFQGCSALAGQITIPASVTRIGQDAFHACNNITEVIFPENSQLQEIAWEAFYMDPSVAQLERFIMPNTVTTLGNGALRGCKKLDWNNFHLSTGVTSLPPHTFCDCGFTEFDLKQTNVTFLDNSVFNGNLFTEFHLPANVSCSAAVFYNCKTLERFYYEDGSTVTAIPNDMFGYCTWLKYIYLPVDPTIEGVSVPTIGGNCFYGTDVTRIFLDVPENAIATYKASSAWANFKYAFSLNSEGSTELTYEDAAKNRWTEYTNGQPDNFTYYYGYLDVGNYMMWTFNNPVVKEYTLLLDAANYYSIDESNHLTISLRKLNDDGTSTEVKNVTEKIFESNRYSAYPHIDHLQQVYVKFDDALPVGKYQLKIVAKGETQKIIKDVQMVPTADLLFVETATSPAGAGRVQYSGKIAQLKTSPSEVTLSTSLPAWATFTNWTENGTEVGTDAEYTFTPTESTTIVANVTPERQVIPTADGQTFDSSKAAAELTYWDGNFFCHVYPDANITYFITNQKHALYKFKFKTCCGEKGAVGSIVTVDVIDEAGNIVLTEAVKPEYTGNWGTFSENVISLSKPLKAGNYSVKMTITHPNNTYVHLVGVKDVSFEYIATVPETIALNKAEATMWIGDTDEQLTPTLTPEDITTGYNEVLWTSSAPAVATVDQTGKVTAVAPGQATITAKATGRTDIELTAACAVTVPQHVTTITVAETAEVYTGENVTVEASVAPSNAEIKTLAWVSSNEAVATVDQNGKITGVKAGTANITVTATDRNKVSKTIAVTVKQKVTAITLNASEKTMHKSETFQLSVSAYAPEDATQKEVTWSSSAPAVATVSETGLVTALAGGTATITATAKDGKGATATCTITVDVPVTSVTLDKTSQNVYINDVVVLTATVAPDDATDATVTWTSSAPTVASVVDGTVTALTAGTAVITATSNYDSSKKATFTLTVMDVQAQGEGANKLLFHNIVNTPDLTDNKVAWKSEADHSWVANSIVLTDAQPYANNADVAATSLTYNREFSAVAWQALYVPFAMNYSDWSSVADVAYINNVHQWDKDDDGVIDLTVLEFITEKTAIEANMPYVIRPKSSGDMSIELSDATLKASPAVDGSVDCSSTRMKYILTGTYREKEMYGTGLYALTPTGEFCYATSADAKLSPFRIYLEIQNRTASPTGMPHKIVVMVDGDIQDEATSIEMINALGGSDAIFNLAGQKVSESYKGVVIKNGKKIYKK